MGRESLFEDLPEALSVAKPSGKARLREPARDRIELRVFDLDALIGPDHAARVIWAPG